MVLVGVRSSQILSDHFIVVNNNGEFGRSLKEIYTVELVLEKENHSDQGATFLYAEISINNGEFEYKIYEKRDGFKVRTIKFSE